MADQPSKTKIVVQRHKYRPRHAKRRAFLRHHAAQFMSFVLVMMLVSTMLPLSAIAGNIGDVAVASDSTTSTATASVDENVAKEAQPAAPTPVADAAASDAAVDTGNTDTTAGDATGAANAGTEAGEDDLTDKVNGAGPAAVPAAPTQTAPSAAAPSRAPRALTAPGVYTWHDTNGSINIDVKWTVNTDGTHHSEITLTRNGQQLGYAEAYPFSENWTSSANGLPTILGHVFVQVYLNGGNLYVNVNKPTLRTVTFTHDGGGTFNEADYTYPDRYNTEPMPAAPDTAPKSGYEFVGWDRIDSNGKLLSNVELSDTVGFGGTYIAVYEQVGYTVTYDLNGGVGNIADDTLYMTGATVKVSGEEPTRDGYVFTGWSYDGGFCQPGEAVVMTEGGITLTALWEQLITDEVVVTAASEARAYNGKPLKNANWEIEGLPEGYTLTATVVGSQPSIGKATNRVTNHSIVRNSDNADVTKYFTNVKYKTGILEVTKIELLFSTNNITAIYDGTAKYSRGLTLETRDRLLPGHILNINGVTYNSLTEVGNVSNSADVSKIKITTGFPYNDVTFYYNCSVDAGTIKVEPREITIKANDDSKVYDGTALTNNGYQLAKGDLAKGQSIQSVVVTGSQSDVGNSANVPSEAIIVDANGNETTANYNITYQNGLLTVSRSTIEIKVTAASDSREYNGKALRNPGYTVSGLPEGYSLTAVVEGVVDDFTIGDRPNKVVEVKIIRDSDGIDVTSFFSEIRKVDGKLSVTKRKIVFETASKTWEYDGQAHQATGLKLISGAYVSDHHVVTDAVVWPSITKVETVENAIDEGDLKIYSPGRYTDMTYFYDIEVNAGKLTIIASAKVITIEANSSSHVYDGTIYTDETIKPLDLPAGVDRVTVEFDVDKTLPGLKSAKQNKGSTPNVIKSYKLWNGEQEVTSYFPEAKLVSGLLTVTERHVVVEGNIYKWKYNGETLEIPADEAYKVIDDQDNKYDGMAKGQKLYALTPAMEFKNVADSGDIVLGLNDLTQVLNGDINSYEFEFRSGSVTILPREITLTSGGANKAYDGTPLINHDALLVGGEGFVFGEGFVADITGTITYPGEEANAFTYRFRYGTLAENYKVTDENFGTLIVTNSEAPITITANRNSKIYDGLPLTDNGYTNSALPAGVTSIEVEVEGSQTNALDGDYTSANVVASHVLYYIDEDGNKKNVTKYFPVVTYEDGTLTVNKRPVTLTSNSDSKAYDGTPLVNTVVSTNEDPWAVGEGFMVGATGSITAVGSTPNTIEYTPALGTDPGNYIITPEVGVLTVYENPNPVVVATPTAAKTYDGVPLVSAAYSVSGLPGGHRLTVTVTGQQLEVGSSENATARDCKITNKGNEDVTPFFTNIVERYGTLTVNPAPIVAAGVGGGGAPAAFVAAPLTIPDAEVPLDDGGAEATTSSATLASQGDNNRSISETPVPRGVGDIADSWALLNLIMAILTIVFALVLATVIATRRNKKTVSNAGNDNQRASRAHVWPAIVSVVAAIGAVVLFAFTENLQLSMQIFDEWTLWQAVIAVVSVALLVFGSVDVKKSSEERAK